MPTATVYFDEENRNAELRGGETLLAAANRADIDIEALCGGNGHCGTCKVQVTAGGSNLQPLSSQEETLLAKAEIESGYRLACQSGIENSGFVSLSVPVVSRQNAPVVLTEGETKEVNVKPTAKTYPVSISRPSVSNIEADFERVQTSIAEQYGRTVDDIDQQILQLLPRLVRSASENRNGRHTVTVYGGREIIDIRTGSSPVGYGVAVDVGSTTLATYLVNLYSGETVAVDSRLNPQRRYGEDIMSRVEYIQRNDAGLDQLQESITSAINDAISTVCNKANIDSGRIYEAVFVGNTAMHHFFVGIDPHTLATSPYVPANHIPITRKARDFGVDISPAGYLYWPPIIGGWVGPDNVSVHLVSGHHERAELTVCIDVGTNGEVSVGNAERTLVTSAPAGPALEGAELTHGVRAKPGAIESVDLDPETFEPTIEVIGDTDPVGICGSGIVDMVAQLFLVGAINRRGRLSDTKESTRIRINSNGNREFVVVSSSKTTTDEAIVLTQKDIRMVQRAKAAIQAATKVLLEEHDGQSVDRLVLAGGFGNSIDPDSAMLIGLYPELDQAELRPLGNAAGSGAKLLLLDREHRKATKRIRKNVEFHELAGNETFHDEYMNAMYLPHRSFDHFPKVRKRIAQMRGIEEDLER